MGLHRFVNDGCGNFATLSLAADSNCFGKPNDVIIEIIEREQLMGFQFPQSECGSKCAVFSLGRISF